IEAYRLAVEAGTDGIELDVRRTSDGVLIVSHDESYPGIGTLSSLEFGAIRELAPKVPTLREAMNSIPGSVFVNVEIKNFPHEKGFDEHRTIVDETIRELRSYDDPKRILMSSFDPVSMHRVRQIAPDLLCSQLVLASVPLNDGMATAREFEMDAINPNIVHVAADTASIMEALAEAKLRVVVWGVNSPEDVVSMATAGVDAIITDDPGMARTVIDQL
ncbi:MAG: glycerophosphodiester phosphodiesterase, partial [Actinomycetia bacterium]|nr:glycerophosphodiester phosphodiesterase [Actinomycetes bacterium]